MTALHELGVRIAIDDFGTGFSSLGQLRDFPLDMIKVDRSFIHGAEHSEKDAAITANLVSLATRSGWSRSRRGSSRRASSTRCARSAATSPRASSSRTR